MRIGIDATALPNRPVGAGRYILHLIESLAQIISTNELLVFIHRSRLPLLDLPKSDRVRLVEINDKQVGWRLIWEQTLLPNLAKRHKLDVLHSPHYTMPLAHPCASVVTFHDMGFMLYPALYTYSKRLVFPLMMRLSARQSDALIADSDSTRADMIRILNIPPHKITTVHLGVTSGFKPIFDRVFLDNVRQKYKLPDKYILYVGTVEPRKNLPQLINAFKRLLEQLPDQHFFIVGRLGWMYKDVVDKLNDPALRDNVHLAGYIPQEDIPAFYNLAEIAVYPSSYEGFGLPVLEAMACGTPVITTDISSMPEIVGDAGVLISQPNEDALFEAMYKLLIDPARRKELSEKGKSRAAAFSWETTARATLEVYQRVLAE